MNTQSEPKPEDMEPKETTFNLSTIKLEKAEGHRSVYANNVICITSTEDVRLVFMRVAAHTKEDSKIYQEVDVYLSPKQAMKVHQLLGRHLQGWKETAKKELEELLNYDTEALNQGERASGAKTLP